MKPISAFGRTVLSAAVPTAALLATVLLAAGGATAQATTEEEPAAVTWGVNPSGQDGPDGRAAFDYALDPGATLVDFVGVSNFGTEPITVQLYASDAYTTETGAFDLLPSDEAPIDVGSWIGFNEQTLAIAPGTRLDVPFALTVPADATPGDHVGGIVAAVVEAATDASGNEILVERRVGARVHLRVSGELDPELTPELGHVSYHYEWNPVEPGSVSFEYAVENAGNVRLQGRLVARIGGPWDLLAHEVVLAELPQILPGDRFEGTAEIDAVWPLAYLDAALIVRPEPVDEADTASRLIPRSEEAGLWAPPWPQAAVAAAAALLIGIAVKTRKRKRRNRTRVAAEPAPEPPPADEGDRTPEPPAEPADAADTAPGEAAPAPDPAAAHPKEPTAP
ncbi:DUF916 domain-containing protein [Glycomyces sp. TRM65418]|uniref:WxL protein peptidoglycan domain-containing protein n=1 Tax=Glycomyces sp. TRM65418 TaxID=2867006 RepID=UPI001CE6518A|nr:DUF916 domain-containing protein [Glycomyces sp. TRM65418]MCC3763114.1 DUF916 domain-containing protein [Glycomyces sp. TRM65418]QZD57122.1 DUF916 domain-containing protein [Glycomyces sp. TRM65418]